MSTFRSTFRLPDGNLTSDRNLYCERWQSLGKRFSDLVSGINYNIVLRGFDPTFMFIDLEQKNGCALNIPPELAISLILNIDGKLPWE